MAYPTNTDVDRLKQEFFLEMAKLPKKERDCLKDMVKYYWQEEGGLRHGQAEGAKSALEIYNQHFAPKWPVDWVAKWIKETL